MARGRLRPCAGPIEVIRPALRGPTTIRMACGAVRVGTLAFVVSLLTGSGLMGHYFLVTPFAICSSSLAAAGVTEVWPWALPLLAADGAALSLVASGLCVLARMHGGVTTINASQERIFS
jgi:hypothetical protein